MNKNLARQIIKTITLEPNQSLSQSWILHKFKNDTISANEIIQTLNYLKLKNYLVSSLENHNNMIERTDYYLTDISLEILENPIILLSKKTAKHPLITGSLGGFLASLLFSLVGKH